MPLAKLLLSVVSKISLFCVPSVTIPWKAGTANPFESLFLLDVAQRILNSFTKQGGLS